MGTLGSTVAMTATRPDSTAIADPDERAQINAALAGDGAAFRILVEPHLPMLYRIAARVGRDSALAEDAVQEALSIAYSQLRRCRPEVPFRAFVAAIATRRAHTLARAERRRASREKAAVVPATPATPDQELDGAVAARRIRAALAAMPKKRRQAALLRLDGGLSYREISLALHTSEGSARVLVHLATKQLRAQLADLLTSTDTSERSDR